MKILSILASFSLIPLIFRLVQKLDRPIADVFRRDIELARLLMVVTDGAANSLTDWMAQQGRGNAFALDPVADYRTRNRGGSRSSSLSSPGRERTRSGSRSSGSRAARPTSRSPTPEESVEGELPEEPMVEELPQDTKDPCPLMRGPDCKMCKCTTLVNPL